jgi:hypothetical protein
MSAALANAGSNRNGIANRNFLSIIGNPGEESFQYIGELC